MDIRSQMVLLTTRLSVLLLTNQHESTNAPLINITKLCVAHKRKISRSYSEIGIYFQIF